MPITKISEKPVTPVDLMLRLLGSIEDLGIYGLMLVATFSGPRASEAMGFQWKSWTGVSLMPYGIAIKGQFYEGRLKTKASRSPIAVPEPVRPVIEAWRRICPDPSPEALMFPTFGRGKRTGQAVPRHAKNFLRWRIRPIAERLEIPARLITFQVMRRSLGTHLSGHGSQGRAGRTTPCEHHDDRQCVRAGCRRERDAGELSCFDGAGRLDAGSGKHGSDGSEREAATGAFFRVRKQFGEI
jgi:integrase